MSQTPMSVALQDMAAESLTGQPILRVRFQELLQAFESATEDLTAFILGDLGVPLHTLLAGIQPPQPAVKLPRLQLVPPDDAPDGPRLRVAGFDEVPANPPEQDA